MKFSKSWLSELLNFEICAAKLAEQLTMVGLEVAEVKPVAGDFCGVVVGVILEVNQHPNADKLTVCSVNIGESEPLTIVCGAANVRPKLKIPVAVIGAILPNNFKIKKARLRGIESIGMMCSAVELGVAETSSGLLELPDDAPIGMDVRQYLMLDDAVIEVELTPDRGDCLNIVGIAREVAAINRIERSQLKPANITTQGSSLPIVIKAPDACPHYCGRIIRGINNNQIATPIWIQERLRRSGIGIINPVVDVANYVMLELGQPLHAFDLAKLDEKIQVRYAVPGEEITLLGGSKIELNAKTLVIADSSRVLAVAGIMGGVDSSVSKDTIDVFLESAFFAPEKMAGQARSYGLQTDASYRYERGVDSRLQLQALDRATSLLLEIVGGKPSDVAEVIVQENMPQCLVVHLRRSKIEKVLGMAIADEDVFAILAHLEMQVELAADGWQVTIPSWRFDLEIEEDLIEEVARIYGYHCIPEQKIIAELMVASPDVASAKRDRLYELMTDLGYYEVITYSFTDAKLQALLDPEHAPLPLVNPISPELAVMRTTLWPGLISAAKYNFCRQEQRVRFFEIGLRFLQRGDSLQQLPTLAGIVLGDVYPEQWGIEQKEQVDFFDLKNDIDAILKLFGHDEHVEYMPTNHPALHPRRSAQICMANTPIGFVGEIHPKVKQELDLSKQVCLFEINLNSITSELKDAFNEFSRFPKTQRDIAIIVNKEITWQQIRQKIVDITGELLHNIELFDIYYGEGVGLNQKSLGIHLIFQSVARTLVDTEIDALINQVVSLLKQTFDANLRG
ncbi:phenylalanine--tRNA ligase subunit beta [Gammaproteobacteria bacterium]